MKEVDFLLRRYVKPLVLHFCISKIIIATTRKKWPPVYNLKSFHQHKTVRNVVIKVTTLFHNILTCSYILKFYYSFKQVTPYAPTLPLASSSLTYITSPHQYSSNYLLGTNHPSKPTQQIHESFCTWFCLDNIIGTTYPKIHVCL